MPVTVEGRCSRVVPEEARRRGHLAAAATLLYLALAVTLAYPAISRYDQNKELYSGDTSQYVEIYQGRPLQEIWSPVRTRVVVPWLASYMPVPPATVLAKYHVDEDKLICFRFALVNLLGTAATACFLYLFMRGLRFGQVEAALGGLLYLLSHEVVVNGASVFVDPWAYAAIAASLWLSSKGRPLASALVIAAGLFVKETVVVVLPLAWLLCPAGRRPRFGLQGLALLPYLAFRIALAGPPGKVYNWQVPLQGLSEMADLHYLAYMGAEYLLNFFWITPLAILGWREASGPWRVLRSAALLLPLFLLGPRLIESEFSREWQLAFPIFIPLAVLGLRRLSRGWPLALRGLFMNAV